MPLIVSIPYANVAISLFNEHGESYIYGYVPIVVAKCGVFLKERATDVEGIFRLAGSEKRIKELKTTFDTPPKWGKGLDWTGYTVHDAANILRRYFNQLPEPIIPLEHYDAFRKPLRGHQAEAVGPLDGQEPSIGGFDPDAAVRVYQLLIRGLPSLNRQLLLYVLDLLAVFAAKSDINKMTTSNLASIFQPGILSHPQHDMSPIDYRLSQDVLIFLIDNQDHFLIGMEGTAVDEGTAKHVQSGPSTPQSRTPTRNKSGIGRSASAASSAAAESIRKFGGVRRNVSTSSRQSRHSGAIPSPIAPTFVTQSSSGVHRSNTVPTKRSPALRSTTLGYEKGSDPPTPSRTSLATERPQPQDLPLPPPLAPHLIAKPPQISASAPTPASASAPAPALAPAPAPVPAAAPATSTTQTAEPNAASENRDAVAALPEDDVAFSRATPNDIPGAYPLPSPGIPTPPAQDLVTTPPAVTVAAQSLAPPETGLRRHGAISAHATPIREKSEFMEGSLDASPTESNPVGRTFTQILARVTPSDDEKKDGRKRNKLQKKPRVVSSSNPSAHSSTASLAGHQTSVESTPSPLHATVAPVPSGSGTKNAPHVQTQDTTSSRTSGATLKPIASPPASFRSHSDTAELSEAEPLESEPSREEKEKEKRSFWRAHRRGESKATVTPTASQSDLSRSVAGATQSMSSFGSSSAGRERRSLQNDSRDLSDVYSSPEKDPEKRSGIGGWFSRHRDKDRDAKKRAKSPTGSSSDVSVMTQPLVQPFVGEQSEQMSPPPALQHQRGPSLDVPRTVPEEREKESRVEESEKQKDSADVTPTGPTSPVSSSAAASAPTSAVGASKPQSPNHDFPPVVPRYTRDQLPIP